MFRSAMVRSVTVLLLGALLVIIPASVSERGRADIAIAGTMKADSRPNMVLVMTDDMREDELRYMPNVRRLIGDEGFAFNQAYSTFPLCCTARTSVVTGQYAHNHHVLGNDAATNGGYYVFKSRSSPRNTLGTWLRKSGYRTSFIGKFMNRYGDRNPREVPPGWDYWAGTPGMQAFDFTNQTYNVNGSLRKIPGHNTRVVTDLALKQMRGGSSPFFVWVNYLAPHDHWAGGSKWTPPVPMNADRKTRMKLGSPDIERNLSDKPSFIRSQPDVAGALLRRVQHQRVQRARSMLGVDRQVGRIVRHLRKTGQLENTVLVFTSDNGYALGNHGIEHGKVYPYESVTGVPLLMRGPGVPVGSTKSMVALHDITPTFLDLAHAQAGRTQDGVSLFDVARSPVEYRSRAMLYESGNVLGHPAIAKIRKGNQFWRAVHVEDWVYIRYYDGQHELYNLTRDPGQKNSLHNVKRFADIERQLAAKLVKLRNCRGKECNTALRLKD